MLDPLLLNVKAYDDKHINNVYGTKWCNALLSKKTKIQCTPPHLIHTQATALNEEAAQPFQLGFA